MKALVFGLLMTLVQSVAWAQIQDVEIKAARQRLDQEKARSGGPVTVKVSEIVYNITVTNKTFKVFPELKVKYMIFYQDGQPGQAGKPPEVSVTGGETLTNLEGNRSATFDTKAFKLSAAQLAGGYYWTSGADARQKDRVTGVWIKVFSPDGRVLGEYANPASVARKNTWK